LSGDRRKQKERQDKQAGSDIHQRIACVPGNIGGLEGDKNSQTIFIKVIVKST
jgi:hypothetical protein